MLTLSTGLSHGLFRKLAVDEPPDPARVAVLQFRRQDVVRKTLVADGAGEAIDRGGPDGGRAGIRGCRLGAAVHHRRTDLDARREAVVNDPAGFLLQDRD